MIDVVNFLSLAFMGLAMLFGSVALVFAGYVLWQLWLDIREGGF